MAKKGPTLFELMRDPTRGRSARVEEAPIAPPAAIDEGDGGYFGQSRAIRVPLGYVFIAGAVTVACMALVYSIGFQSGQKQRDRLDAQRLQASAPAEETAPIRDPLLAQTTGGQPSRVESSPPPRERSRPTSAPSGGDPRIPDLNYFIVLYDSPEQSERAAAFLRRNGVDAAVVPANNGRFRYVVSLTGFAASEVGSASYQSHREELRRLGRIWKRDHNGSQDFNEVWAQKYRAPQQQADASSAGD